MTFLTLILLAGLALPDAEQVIDALKMAGRRAGEDVIDLGFGNPDLPSPQVAVHTEGTWRSHLTRMATAAGDRFIHFLRRYIMVFKLALAALSVSLAAGSAVAQIKPEDAIKFRQSLMNIPRSVA